MTNTSIKMYKGAFIGVFKKDGELLFTLTNRVDAPAFIMEALIKLYEETVECVLQEGHYVAWDYDRKPGE